MDKQRVAGITNAMLDTQWAVSQAQNPLVEVCGKEKMQWETRR